MPGNTVRINNSDSFSWYVGDSQMKELIKRLNQIGFREKREATTPKATK